MPLWLPGCRILWFLARSDDNRIKIAQRGAIRRILDALSNHRSHAEVVENCYGALASLALEENSKFVITQEGCINMILEVTTTGDTRRC